MADKNNNDLEIPSSMRGEPVSPPEVDLFAESGRSGLTQFAGYVREEILPELSGRQWLRVAKQMLWNDSIINAMFLTVEILCRQVKFDIVGGSDDPAGEEGRDFVRGCLFDDMNQPFTETLSECLTMLPWGFHWAETVYKKRNGPTEDGTSSIFNDGKIGWRKWAPRAQETLLHWTFTPTGEVKYFVQLSPPDWKIIPIPIEKSLLFRTSTNKANPEGRSLLRACYVPYYFSTKIQNLEGIGIERDAAGIPYMTMPMEYMSPTATEAQKRIYQDGQQIVTNVRNNHQAGYVIPSDTWKDAEGNPTSVKMFELGLVSSAGGKQFDTAKVIERHDRRKLMVLLADFIVMGHEKVGSFALADSKTELFSDACGGYLDAICEVINRYAIPRLLRINGMPADKPCRLIHGDIENISLEEIGGFIVNLAQAGMNIEPIAKQLYERGGFEMPKDTELMAPQPAVPPPGVPSAGVPGTPQPVADLGEYPPGTPQAAAAREPKRRFSFSPVSGKRQFSMPSKKQGVTTEDVTQTIARLKRLRFDEAASLMQAGKLDIKKRRNGEHK